MILEAGQRWRYHTRPGEERSRVTVLEIDAKTVHVHVDSVDVTSAAGSTLRSLFLPVSHPALEQSLAVLEGPAAGFDRLRGEWLQANDTRDRGHFTVPLSQILTFIDRGGKERGDDAS